jgi:predicted nucleic acid-binding protein
MFLECALRAKAELLVTGDNDLLVLKEFRGTRMVTPSVYVHAA